MQLHILHNRLLAAEEAVLARGGNVMRLAGLYTERRGPHSYWLNKAREGAGTELGVIQGSADGQLNMLHYEDAASAVVALAQSNGAFFAALVSLQSLIIFRCILFFARVGFRSKIFLACDNELITKKEICLSALASGLFAGCPLPQVQYCHLCIVGFKGSHQRFCVYHHNYVYDLVLILHIYNFNSIVFGVRRACR